MKIAREGNIFIIPLIVFTLILTVYSYVFSITLIPVYLFLSLLLFFFIFFRDPYRQCTENENIIISPADGKIIKIEEVDDPDVGNAFFISIFLNVFNVHVNRMPINGEFKKVNYYDGKFLAAFNHKASNENERTEILIRSEIGNIKLRQVAGLVARRILCYAKAKKTMKIGERLGFIRFGSRTDLIIPKDVTLAVQLGQKVKGNKTIIAKYI